MILATEDAIGEAVAIRLLKDHPGVTVGALLGGKGKGYLRRRAQELNRTARSLPVFLLIDLDTQAQCAADVIGDWVGKRSSKLLFRIAVMEVESWLLADRDEFAQAFGIGLDRIPANTDSIPQPKELIVKLARKSRFKTIRHDLVPSEGSTAVVGPAYNVALTRFVRSRWNPTVAALNSPSLKKAIDRLAELNA